MIITRAILVAAIAGGALSGAARAEVFYNNLSDSSVGILANAPNADSAGNPTSSGDGPLAASFSTGSSSVSKLDVQLLLTGDPGGPSSTVVSVLADDGNSNPGQALQTLGKLSDSALPGSGRNAVYDFRATLNQSLNPNTRYWIELADSNAESLDYTQFTTAQWSLGGDMTQAGVGSEYYFADGTTFPNNNNETDIPTPPVSPGAFQMCVSDGAAGSAGGCPAVPEPATIGLLGTGIAGIGAAFRTRRTS